MKRFLGFALILSSLSIPAFAAKNSQTITLNDPVSVGSTKLPAGEYKISWTGTAPDVQVTVEQKNGRHPVTATVAAKLVAEKNGRTQITTGTDAGVTTIKTVQLKEVSLTFTGTPVSGQ